MAAKKEPTHTPTPPPAGPPLGPQVPDPARNPPSQSAHPEPEGSVPPRMPEPREGEQDEGGAEGPASAFHFREARGEAFAAPRHASRGTEPVSEVEELRHRVAAMEKLLAAQQPVLQPVAQAQEREREVQAKVAELSQSVTGRSQAEARRRWRDSATEYPVSVADVPEILIPARSPEEARARYDQLCGINSVDPDRWEYKIGDSRPRPPLPGGEEG